jgi:hypothetical protein
MTDTKKMQLLVPSSPCPLFFFLAALELELCFMLAKQATNLFMMFDYKSVYFIIPFLAFVF